MAARESRDVSGCWTSGTPRHASRGDSRMARALRLVATRASILSVVALLSGICTVVRVHAQTAGTAAASPTPSANSPSTLQVQNLQEQIDSLRTEQSSLHDFVSWLLIPLGITVSVIGAGGVLGFVLSVRGESRTGELHDVRLTGELAAQARAEQSHASFLEASQKTLTLVNDTLTLAKDANERAARTMAQRAEQNQKEIDARAHALVREAFQLTDFKTKTFKIFVEAPEIKSELDELASRLSSIEGYLDLQHIALTPACFFVKGMARHLRQEARRAIEDLERATEAEGRRSRNLVIAAHYWMGYESNNLRRFSQAANSFKRALELEQKGSAQYFELRRIKLESDFFELARAFRASQLNGTAKQSSSALIKPLERQLNDVLKEAKAADDTGGVSGGILTLHGNILTWAARNTEDERVAHELLTQAVAVFPETGASIWANFGRLDAQSELGHEIDDDDWQGVVWDAVARTSVRTEPRSLALLHETSLIALSKQRTPREWESTYRALKEALAKVDASLTLYSQREKYNVPRDEFDREVEALHATMLARQPGAPSTPTPGDETVVA